MAFKHKLGLEGKDKISGFEGIITARVEHLTGCNHYWLAPRKLGPDGKRIESESFDEDRIEIIGQGIAPEDVQPPKKEVGRRVGGEKLKATPGV